MPERTWKCPNCGAALAPHRFARSAQCGHCGTVVQVDEAAVSSARFREALTAARATGQASGGVFRLSGEAWAVLRRVASGEIADLHLVERVRPPQARAIAKVLRSEGDRPMLEAERAALSALRASDAPGAEAFAALLPMPLAHGVVEDGPFAGASATLLRFVPGFDATLEDARAAWPHGVDPHAGVWIWRRALEVLSFVHRSGWVHGAVLPQHLLLERGEHGLRLVGWGCAARRGGPLAAVVERYESFYPREALGGRGLEPSDDLRMCARSVAHALGADEAGRLPRGVPGPLRDLLVAASAGWERADAWAMRERVGRIAEGAFGPPSFHPLAVPLDPR